MIFDLVVDLFKVRLHVAFGLEGLIADKAGDGSGLLVNVPDVGPQVGLCC